MKKLFITLVFTLFAACANSQSVPTDFGTRVGSYVAAGDCTSAINVVGSISLPYPTYYSLLGLVAEQCEKDVDKALRFYKQGARWNDQFSIDALLRIGNDVPYPDLQVQDQNSRIQQQQANANAARAYADSQRPLISQEFINSMQVVKPNHSTTTSCQMIGEIMNCSSR